MSYDVRKLLAIAVIARCPLRMRSIAWPICNKLILTTFWSPWPYLFIHFATCTVLWRRIASVIYQNTVQSTFKAKTFITHAPCHVTYRHGVKASTYLLIHYSTQLYKGCLFLRPLMVKVNSSENFPSSAPKVPNFGVFRDLGSHVWKSDFYWEIYICRWIHVA